MFWFFFPLSFKDLLFDITALNRELRYYFIKTDDANKETSSGSQKVSLIIQSSSNIAGEMEIQNVQ